MLEAASLTDDEFAYAEVAALDTQEYSIEVYSALLAVLDAREALSSTRDRLKYYMMARGVAVVAPAVGSSKIYLGGAL